MAKSDHHSRPFRGTYSYRGPLGLVTIIILAMLSFHLFS